MIIISRKITIVAVLLFLTCLFSLNLLSQSKGTSSYDIEQMIQDELKLRTNEEKLTTETVVFGNSIKADLYKLGPGDILSYLNLTVSPIPQLLRVTPENNIIVPRIGVLESNSTLSDFRKKMSDIISNKTPGATVYITLFQPRVVLVSIKGDVPMPGEYSFPATFKISTAIKASKYASLKSPSQSPLRLDYYERQYQNRETEQLASGMGLPYETMRNLRNIKVRHSDGSMIISDYERAVIMNEDEFDPYIREGDEITVPFDVIAGVTVSIIGAVNNPTNIPFKKNDKTSFLLKIGGGLAPDADRNNVQLVLPEFNKTYKLNIDSNNNLIGEDYELCPNARIIAAKKAKTLEKKDGWVSVTGAVNNEGIYPIKHSETRLKDIIKLAGGFTSEAALNLAYIIRIPDEMHSEISSSVSRKKFQYFNHSDLTLEDTSRYSLDMSFRKPVVSCDFKAAFENNSELDNALLNDEDMIVVPKIPTSIYIFGQVNNPGYITFEKGKSLDWYVARAGGYAAGADKSRSRIIRGRTKVWTEKDSEVFVDAGDEVYVPRYPDLPPGTELQKYGVIVSVLASAAAFISLMINIFRK